MADIAVFFEKPRQRASEHLSAGLRRLAARLAGLHARAELADARLDLDARQRDDAGLSAPRGFERVGFMLRGGIR